MWYVKLLFPSVSFLPAAKVQYIINRRLSVGPRDSLDQWTVCSSTSVSVSPVSRGFQSIAVSACLQSISGLHRRMLQRWLPLSAHFEKWDRTHHGRKTHSSQISPTKSRLLCLTWDNRIIYSNHIGCLLQASPTYILTPALSLPLGTNLALFHHFIFTQACHVHSSDAR